MLHRELLNMYVSIHVEIELVVYHALFPIIQLFRQVRILLTSTCKQINLQVPGSARYRAPGISDIQVLTDLLF